MLRQESHWWSVLLQMPEQALHCCCLTLRSHDTRAQLWLHGKVKLWCSGIPLIKPASLTKPKFISNFQILHTEFRELLPYRFSLNAKTCRCTWSQGFLLFPSQQLSLPERSNEQSPSFHIWGSICIVASDPGVCGGTVDCYSTNNLLLQKVTGYTPASTKKGSCLVQ